MGESFIKGALYSHIFHHSIARACGAADENERIVIAFYWNSRKVVDSTTNCAQLIHSEFSIFLGSVTLPWKMLFLRAITITSINRTFNFTQFHVTSQIHSCRDRKKSVNLLTKALKTSISW